MDLSSVPISESEDRLTRWCLFLGITIWFIDLNMVYALPSLSCEWGWFRFTIAGIPGLVMIETIITLIAMLLMSVMIYLPWRNWRKFQTEKPTANPEILQDTEKDRRSLLAFVAMLLNSFFFLFMIATLVPILALYVCARG
jgi:uncharacterized membrane protein